MASEFRVIDTGLRGGRANIAFDAALIETHKASDGPDTIRFIHFPPTALVGRHQALGREIRLDHCRRHGIGVARRVTGGGAIFMDEGQLGWELVFHRATLGIAGLGELAEAICEAAAEGLSGLGVEARYRPRNDIEVEGRKLCGSGGYFDGDTLIYQGTVLIDTDLEDMTAALNMPRQTTAGDEPDTAARRMVTLGELLGNGLPALPAIQDALLAGFARRLGIEPKPGETTGAEEALAKRLYDDEIGTDAFVAEIDDPDSDDAMVSATHSSPGGTLRAYVRLDGAARDRVREVLITGDFFVAPPRAVFDLEASLRGVRVAEMGDAVERFFADYQLGLSTVAAADFRTVLEAAAGGAD
ncbi:MAG: biotin/lipoate A/B protein ligase family protein [Rhodospirillales bacterium]|nr:biotin/lipoate A/B protein ligase family protein [Rhodospirillales bacterium]